jgi:hypothetical protein
MRTEFIGVAIYLVTHEVKLLNQIADAYGKGVLFYLAILSSGLIFVSLRHHLEVHNDRD